MIELRVGQKVDITWQHAESSGIPDFYYPGVIVTGFRDDGLLGTYRMDKSGITDEVSGGCFPWEYCTFKASSDGQKELERYKARLSAAEHLVKDVEKWLGSAPRVIRERIKAATGA